MAICEREPSRCEVWYTYLRLKAGGVGNIFGPGIKCISNEKGLTKYWPWESPFHQDPITQQIILNIASVDENPVHDF